MHCAFHVCVCDVVVFCVDGKVWPSSLVVQVLAVDLCVCVCMCVFSVVKV